MAVRTRLITLFVTILAVMLLVTGWATLSQPLWQWHGLMTRPDHAWTIATLADAYCGFFTFCAWVCCKERSPLRRGLWFVAIMLLGNIAMAVYVLMELRRLGPDDSIDVLLVRRNN